MTSGVAVGSGIFIGLGLVAMGTFILLYGKEYPTMRRKESISLIITLTITATFCCWLFWVCVYISQMFPLLDPVHKVIES